MAIRIRWRIRYCLGEILFSLHKDFIQISTVNAHMAGNVGNLNVIGIIVVNIFPGSLQVLMCYLFPLFVRRILHAGQEKQKVACEPKLVFIRTLKRLQQKFYKNRKDAGLFL